MTMLLSEDQTTAIFLFASTISVVLRSAFWYRSRGAHLGKPNTGKTIARNFRPTKPLTKKDELIIQMLDEHEHDEADMTAMLYLAMLVGSAQPAPYIQPERLWEQNRPECGPTCGVCICYPRGFCRCEAGERD